METTEQVVFTGEGFEVRVDNSGNYTLWLHVQTGENVYDMVTIMPAILERIERGERPAGVLKKEVERIALHVEQLNGAVSTLFSTYARMIAPKVVKEKKLSTAYKARFALLDGMKFKMLKEYARDYIPDEVDNYVISDASEREALIHRLCEVLVEEKEENREEE